MDSVHIYEVSPRDGLQNESTVVPTEGKAALIGSLVACGVRDIEVTSFVRPRWIPQLSDAAELMRALPVYEGVRYWALIPNQVGLDRAVECGVRHIATFLSASETHNKKNVNRTVRESLASVEEVIGVATDESMGIRAYISTVFGCPFEGAVPIENTLRIADRLLAAGAHSLALGDTTGMANPAQVERVLEAVLGLGVGVDRIAVHFHDTRGTALANVVAAVRMGVRQIDGSVGGMGGCPYAPGASGNAATEDLVHVLDAMGYSTGIDLSGLARAGSLAEELVGRPLPGRYLQYWKGAQVRTAAAKSA